MSDPGRTAYEVLGVHPTAPGDLISACYWSLTKEIQARRSDEDANKDLHRLTRAYELVSDPVRRAGYNVSIGYVEEPLTKRPLPRKPFFLARLFRRGRRFGWSVDPHEVLGLHPSAPQSCVAEGFRIMRDTYLRLHLSPVRRRALLRLLEESYTVLADPEQRAALKDSPQRSIDETAIAVPAQPQSFSASERDPGVDAPAQISSVTGQAPPSAEERTGRTVVIARGKRVILVAARASLNAIIWVLGMIGMFAMWLVISVGWVLSRIWMGVQRFVEALEKRRQARERVFEESDGLPDSPDEVYLDRLASTVKESTAKTVPNDKTA